MDGVWVFSGGGDFPAAIFTTRDLADMWIASHELSGTLTKYPLDIGLYEWALNRGAFKPIRPDQSGARFIERFSSASLEHYHYEDGRNCQEKQFPTT
jgi:hypothetical protein